MTRRIAARELLPRIVGVIASRQDLLRATGMRRAPDLFEVRLDALWPELEEVTATLGRLSAPLIITARDPREDGANALSPSIRRDLHRQFLQFARYQDVELRNARTFTFDLPEHVQRILSFHDFTDTPMISVLAKKAAVARSHRAAIFKIATRTDTIAQLDRLLAFFDETHTQIPLAAMGMGKLGAESRRELARRGSVLNYAPIGTAQVKGQLTLRRLRQVLRRDR